MTAFHAQAIEKILDEKIADPEWALLLIDVHRKLRHREYGPALLVDAIFQNFMGPVTIEDAFAFTLVWSHVMAGELCLREIEVGQAPHDDRRRATNQAILRKLPPPFVASVDVDQSGADDDGNLEWTAPIQIQRCAIGRPEAWECPPRVIPLEIGSTKASRTILHVRQSRALARWPYGHASIMLFVAHPSMPRVNIWRPPTSNEKKEG